MVPGDRGVRGMAPQLVEQRLGRLERQPVHVCVRSAPQVQRIGAGFRMAADDRMAGAGALAKVLVGEVALAQLPARGVAAVVLDRAPAHCVAQRLGQPLAGEV
ncbi:MAG: hypothetical protein ACK559_11160, partial [bacterium]